ncbi:MAG: hypothetical protein ACOYOF_20085 [Verrucomicrobiaceae bacterium]
MVEQELARVIRHRNDGFTHPFATDRSPGTEDFARLLRNLEGASQERLMRILDAVDAVANSHHGCDNCRGNILVFAELLAINRLPERHAIYTGATEGLFRKTGRDFRREVLEHLASCCRPVRPRLRARELLQCYNDMIRRSPWGLHLEGLSEELATQLSGKAEWILVVGKAASEKVAESLRSRCSPGKRDGLTFAIAKLVCEGAQSQDRCAVFWSKREETPVHLQVIDAMPEGSAAVTCVNTQLKVFSQGESISLTGPFERINEAVRVLLGWENPPFIQALDCHSGFETWVRHARGETVWFGEAPRQKRGNRSQEILNELRRRKQQRVEDALADANLPEQVRKLLVECLPLWKDEPDTLVGDFLPLPGRRGGSRTPNAPSDSNSEA